MIYFIGDSFGTGVELYDDTIPSFPGYHILYDQSVRLKWMEEKNRYIESNIGWDEYYKKSMDRSVASELGRLTNLPVHNSSMAGGSMMYYLARLQSDFTDRKLCESITHVYVMVTSHNRTALFNGAETKAHEQISNVSPQFIDFEVKRGTKYMVAWAEEEDNTAMAVRWLMFFNAIRATVRSSTGREPIFLDSLFVERTKFLGLRDRALTGMFSNLRDEALPFLPDAQNTMYTYSKGEHMPSGHLTPRAHVAMAEALLGRYHK